MEILYKSTKSSIYFTDIFCFCTYTFV
jgi:hypothetical protein